MSLKAKIEAVIYASEEPVTLAQLMGLLGQEAQAELDHLESAQHMLALNAESAPAESNSDDISAEDINAMAESTTEENAEAIEQVSEEPLAGEAESSVPSEVEAAPVEASAGEAAPDAATAESAAVEPPDADAEAAPVEAVVADVTVGVAEPDAPVEKDEKQLAKEEKERTRRLREYFREILDQLIADYAKSERGLEIREVASGFRLATKPEYHDAVRGFVKSLKPPLKLTLQALETLAVVAYKQPVTAPEISEIRGVDSGGVLGSLISRKLIATAGRKQVIGRPILYKTTRDFLLRFGLKDVSELPSIEEFEKLAGELADSEAVQEEIPMTEPAPNEAVEELAEDLEPSKGESGPQADGDTTPLDEAHDETHVGTAEPTLATPEGDNEAPPDDPLEPVAEDLETPPSIDTNKL